MILSVILGGRSYPREKYIFVSMIVVGVILFMYKDGVIDENFENETFGELLVFLSLFMDGLSAAVQVRTPHTSYEFLNITFKIFNLVGTNASQVCSNGSAHDVEY